MDESPSFRHLQTHKTALFAACRFGNGGVQLAHGKTRRDARCARLAAATVLAVALLTPTSAFATVDQLVLQALELEEQGKPGEAFVLLDAQAASRAGDPDFDYAFGLAAADRPLCIIRTQIHGRLRIVR